MTLLTKRQEALLAQVREANDALRNARRTADREARLIVAERITAFEASRDNVVRLAFAENIPQQKIGRDGLGTSDWSTVSRILKRTEEIAGALAAANNPLAGRYRIEGDKIRVTLTREEITRVEKDYRENYPLDVPNSALFTVHPTGVYFAEERWLGSYEHPLSRWAYEDANKAELRDWAAEHFTALTAPTEPAPVAGAVTELDAGEDED
jgi:hypothetical protein